MNLTDKELKKIREVLELQEKQKKTIAFNKKIVSLVIFLNIVFTTVILYLYYVGWSEPATLIDRWFKFTGTELIALAGIKGLDIVKEMVDVWKGE